MLGINWLDEKRNDDIELYLVDPENDSHSRLKAFQKGWTRYLNGKAPEEIPGVSWEGLGMLYASSLGQVGKEVKIGVYRALLSQYLSTSRMSRWPAEKREKALRLVEDL